MKALVLYHAHCIDGFGSAWVFHDRMEKLYASTQYIAVSYGEPIPEIADPIDTDVFILDFSYPADVLVRLAATVNFVCLIDHHEGMQNELLNLRDSVQCPMNLEIVFSLEKSGALLTWERVAGTPMLAYPPSMIQYISDRDLWQFKFPETKPFILGLMQYPKEFEIWDDVAKEVIPCTREGHILQRYYDQQLKSVLAAENITELVLADTSGNEHKGLAVNASPIFASDAGNELAKISGTFGCVWHRTGDGKFKLSLRSIGEYSVIEIAKNYGGGGHRNASGCTVGFIP